jgi:hypothetical protein
MGMAQPSSRQLGEFLLERKVLSRDVLELALDREEREGVPMAALLLGEGLVGEKDIIAAVAGQVGIPFVDLSVTPVRPDLERFLPEDVAARTFTSRSACLPRSGWTAASNRSATSRS